MAKDPPMHQHGSGCFESRLACSTTPHNHDDHCRNYKGQLTCSRAEHQHSYANCYKSVLNCDR